jgi:hypothetical protein
MRPAPLRVIPFVNDKVAELHRMRGLLARAAREAPADPMVRAALRAGVETALGQLESVRRELRTLGRGLR